MFSINKKNIPSHLLKYFQPKRVYKPKDVAMIPHKVFDALMADGWYGRSDCIWSKKNCLPESITDRPTKSHEYVFLLTKSPRYWYDQDAIREPIANSSVQRINQPNFDNQTGGPKDYRNGVNTNRSARNTLENFKKSSNQGRNCRTVWSIPTQSFRAAHFAVFPEALAERCILAGCPSQVCVECGEPWVRVVEKTGIDYKSQERINTQKSKLSKNRINKLDGKNFQPSNIGTNQLLPTCQCSASSRPGIVLDPFFGAGTVAVVATKLKRNWLGIELNPDYIDLARERIARTQPALFAR